MSNYLHILQTASSSCPIVFHTLNNCEREQCTFYWAVGPSATIEARTDPLHCKN